MIIYTIMTLVCLVLDFCVIFVGIADMNNDVGPYGSVFIYLMGVLYFLISLYHLVWVIAVRMRLPESIRGDLMKGLLGLFKGMKTSLDEKYQEINGEAPPKDEVSKPAAASVSGKPGNDGK